MIWHCNIKGQAFQLTDDISTLEKNLLYMKAV